MHKRYSWRSYTSLSLSVLAVVSFLLVDFIATATLELVGSFILLFFIGATVASAVLACVAMLKKEEKKGLAIAALFISAFNSFILLFFMWFGANFSY